MLELAHLEYFKHIIFSWGMSHITRGCFHINHVAWGWPQIASSIDMTIEEGYGKVWKPEEWLSFERYLDRRVVAPYS